MPTEIKTKQTFGGNDFAVMRPENEQMPPKLNIILSFQDALKLQFSLHQALAKVNTYKRSTTDGKRAAINICVHRDLKRITVLEDKLPRLTKQES